MLSGSVSIAFRANERLVRREKDARARGTSTHQFDERSSECTEIGTSHTLPRPMSSAWAFRRTSSRRSCGISSMTRPSANSRQTIMTHSAACDTAETLVASTSKQSAADRLSLIGVQYAAAAQPAKIRTRPSPNPTPNRARWSVQLRCPDVSPFLTAASSVGDAAHAATMLSMATCLRYPPGPPTPGSPASMVKQSSRRGPRYDSPSAPGAALRVGSVSSVTSRAAQLEHRARVDHPSKISVSPCGDPE